MITFCETQLSKLWRAFGKLIYDITRKVFFNTFHNKSTTETFQTLHQFLKQNKNLLKKLIWHNDDIKGFFTAIPHEAIISSFEFMVHKYIDRFLPRNADLQDSWITVDYDCPAKKPRTIQGRAIKTKTSVRFRIVDIIPLVKMCLRTSMFTSLGKIHSQIRGSCIGNPSSPPISEVPIAFKEFMWQEIFNVIINDTLFACRYVDNRLLCLPNHLDCLPRWRILSDLFFYDHPVELEKEPGMTFLGFDIDIHQGTVQYVYPKKSWHFRSPKSAGKTSTLLSGLVSRIHLIARHSYPEDLVKPTIKHLIKMYINIGFTNDQIIACIKKTLKQYDIRKDQVM